MKVNFALDTTEHLSKETVAEVVAEVEAQRHITIPPYRPTKITLHCAEGRYAGTTVEFTRSSMLSEANGRLYTWRTESPKGGGYDKVDCTVEFCNGALSYYIRIDLSQDDPHYTIGRNILHELRFWAGEGRPHHIDEERYALLLEEFAETHERAKVWLTCLDIPYLKMDL